MFSNQMVQVTLPILYVLSQITQALYVQSFLL